MTEMSFSSFKITFKFTDYKIQKKHDMKTAYIFVNFYINNHSYKHTKCWYMKLYMKINTWKGAYINKFQ